MGLEDLDAAVRFAQLDFVQKLPEGLDTYVGSGGPAGKQAGICSVFWESFFGCFFGGSFQGGFLKFHPRGEIWGGSSGLLGGSFLVCFLFT